MNTSTNMFKPSMIRAVPDSTQPPLPAVQQSNTEDAPLEEAQIVEKWDEMSLPDNVLRGIFSYGYEDPSQD